MSTITQGAFPKNKRPGIFAFTHMKYKEHVPFWPEMFYRTTSTMMYEEFVSGNTFGHVPVKDEADNIAYASESQAFTHQVTPVIYAMGYQVTYEEGKNDLYETLGKRRGARLALAFQRTKEVVHANLFNRAFNSSYTFGDGKELCATDHPTYFGNQSNELSTPADLSEAAVEDLCILIRKAVDNVGNKINLMPEKLVYAPDNCFNATRILESDLQSGTANNDVNAIKSRGPIKKHMDNPYFDDSDAFFILTDIAQTDQGLVHLEREGFQMDRDNDSDKLVEKHYGFEWYARTCADFRSVYGSPGA